LGVEHGGGGWVGGHVVGSAVVGGVWVF